MMLAQEREQFPQRRPIPVSGSFVRTSKEYDKFKIDPRNRKIIPSHVTELTEAIKAKNLLREFPIVVDASMTIIDGQHRWAAAKALGVELSYITSATATIEDIGPTTSLVSKWTGNEYLEYWCARGNMEYIRAREFMKKYPQFAFSIAVRLAASSDNCHARVFREGGFVCGRIDQAEKVLEAATDFKPYFRYWNQSTFVFAIRTLFVDPEYDHQRMMGKMAHVSSRLRHCSKVEHYIALFSDIYNWKTMPGHYHEFRPQKIYR